MTRGPGARSKRARLTSPELTRVDRAPCSPTPSGAFSLRRPRARRPSLHPLRALFFTPRAFPNVSRSDGGASPSRGARRRPAERSGLTPRAPNPSVIPSGAPRASHDRRRTGSGPRAPRRGAPLPQTFPLAPRPPRPGCVFFSALAPSPFPTGARPPAGSDRPDPPSSRRETYSEACARPPPRARARRVELPTPVRPNGPHFSPLNPSGRARVVRVEFRG